MTPAHWKKLEAEAQEVVGRTIAELPPEIRAEAEKVPCLFQAENEDDPDLLGIYCEFTPGMVSDANGPIILYLAALDDFCVDEGADFAEEVRLTYLHELGHHLGWDEGDLEARGLE
jgi:predicted Zn-dependent protease with MMP-like domain